MGSVELVPVGQKYSTEYKINPNNNSQVIFENTIKTIHQVWNNTNGKYIVTLQMQFDLLVYHQKLSLIKNTRNLAKKHVIQ